MRHEDSPLISRDAFEALAQQVLSQLPGPDAQYISLHLSAEHTHFIRFNHAQVRQATDVAQAQLTLGVTRGLRGAGCAMSLSGVLADDVARVLTAARALSSDLDHLPDDPHTFLPTTRMDTCQDDGDDALHTAWPDAREVVASVAQVAQDAAGPHDLVGLYAAGPIVRAYADNRGQRNWFRHRSFALDWSHVLHADQAVKSLIAGPITPGCWSGTTDAPGVHDRLRHRMAESAQQLRLLQQPTKALKPGRYKAWLAPAAMAEILTTLAWGAFGLKEQRTGTSPFNRLLHGESLHALVHLSEAISPALAPAFTPQGFVRPEHVPLVQAGRIADSLVSPRTAREFGSDAGGPDLQPNSHGGESPDVLQLAPGTLAAADVLRQLGTGLYLSNLHYLNYSDRLQCRVTGMTRYACFWVEDGQIRAPLPVMRFDQDVIRLLGDDLLDLGAEAPWQPDLQTYGQRSVGGVRTPGALVAGLDLTL